MRHNALPLWVWAILPLTAGAAVQAGDYAVDWWTIDSGGAGPSNASTGGSYALSATTLSQ
jgi:hypothetical protein